MAAPAGPGSGREHRHAENRPVLGGQRDEVPITRLIALYGSASEREMREQLIFVYSQHDSPEAVDKLMEIARSDGDPELRRQAIFWLSQSDDPRVVDFLMEIINP